MGSSHGNDPQYAVLPYTVEADYFDEGELFKEFAGPDAASDARTFFDELKKDLNVCAVWLNRLEGTEWKIVEYVTRGSKGGKWVKTDPEEDSAADAIED